MMACLRNTLTRSPLTKLSGSAPHMYNVALLALDRTSNEHDCAFLLMLSIPETTVSDFILIEDFIYSILRCQSERWPLIKWTFLAISIRSF